LNLAYGNRTSGKNGRGSSALKIAVSERNMVSGGNDVPI